MRHFSRRLRKNTPKPLPYKGPQPIDSEHSTLRALYSVWVSRRIICNLLTCAAQNRDALNEPLAAAVGAVPPSVFPQSPLATPARAAAVLAFVAAPVAGHQAAALAARWRVQHPW